MRLARGLQISRNESLQLLFVSLGVTNFVSIIDVIAVVVDRWNIEGAALGHRLDRRVVHIRRVLERIRTGTHGIPRSIWPVGMNRYFLSKLVGGIYRCFDLLIAIGLKSGDVVIGAGRSVHFDHVRACRNLLAQGFQDFRHTIRNSARRRVHSRFVGCIRDVESVAAYKHARPDHFAAVDQVPHGDVQILVRAEVPHGRDTGLQRAHCALSREEQFHGWRIARELFQHRLAGSLVRVHRHVRMGVDQPRQSGVLREVDDLGARGNRRQVRGHAANPVTVNDHNRIRP